MIRPTAPALPRDPTAPLETALEAAGYRLTEPRRAVARLIAAREGHFSAADLIDDARVRGLASGAPRSFRSLELMTELGVSSASTTIGRAAYVACEPVHHTMFVCEACGRVTEIDDRGLAAAVWDIERRTGWMVESHRLELYGRCPRCRRRRPS